MVKRIELAPNSLPLQMQILPGTSPFVMVGLKNSVVKLIDFMNEHNQSEIQTLHENLTALKICPNGRYVLTAGNRGDVCLWRIKRKVFQPEVLADAIHVHNA